MNADAALRTDPGTASTRRPRAAASSTVWRDPPRGWDSTTTTTDPSAAMMRLRAGKRQGSGAAPNGASLSSTPARATSSHSRAWAFG